MAGISKADERKLTDWRETRALDRRALELFAGGVALDEAYKQAADERGAAQRAAKEATQNVGGLIL